MQQKWAHKARRKREPACTCVQAGPWRLRPGSRGLTELDKVRGTKDGGCFSGRGGGDDERDDDGLSYTRGRPEKRSSPA